MTYVTLRMTSAGVLKLRNSVHQVEGLVGDYKDTVLSPVTPTTPQP